MERIKQALERARQEQQGRQPQPPATAKPPEPQPDTPGPEKTIPGTPSQITYSSTHSFMVQPRVLQENRVVTGLEADVVTAAYKMLRTQVLQRMREKGWNVLAVTSAGSGEGKTLTAVNLAVSLAKDVNHSVLLVDLDLRRPSVHRYFGFTPEKGLSDHLLADTPLPEILFNPGMERLVILPSREPMLHSSEVLSSPKMVQLVEELKSRYPARLVLFDLPPLLSADDALAFTPYVDAALVVIEEGKTNREQLLTAMDFLSVTNVLGTVLNKSEEAMDTYGYKVG
ncbi:MAG: CpsD/CapB family tyrosine-protein kinase [Gammaproteobacteria bacterium]|nr:CpsD/CapB family tyrosine-protein kinase [Gammaproteobacteria bacterium]